MKTASLVSASAIVVIANSLAVLHGVRNRGTREADVTLTQRELRYFRHSADDDDSGVTLHLQWTDPSSFPGLPRPDLVPDWLDREKLQRLGFDCSLSPSSPDAGRYYERQRSRRAFVALEYEGPAWRSWLEAYERALTEQRARMPVNGAPETAANVSRLVALDADLDPVQLRARHPDRTAAVIVPAAVSVSLQPRPYPGMRVDAQHPLRIVGRVEQIPSEIEVPRPFSDEFRHRKARLGRFNQDTGYRVHLRYGASWEPWVTGVEFTN